MTLELFTDVRAPITSQHDWARQLNIAGVADLRIRAGQLTDKVQVDVQGPETDPVYHVSGMISSSNELILPGGRFRLAEAAQAARWLDELGRKGLPKKETPRGSFGLTAEQLEKVRQNLAQPVAFSTRGLAREQVVAKFGASLEPALQLPSGTLAVDSEDKLGEELSGMSCGAALACALRPAGLGFVPRVGPGGTLQYAVVRGGPDVEIWPIGWPTQKPLPEVLPMLYESLNANVLDRPVSEVLGVLSKRLKVPFLLDHNALARHRIDPDKKKVNSPKSRITYNQLLRKILSQSGLRSEVRVDEAGKPLLWISTMKP